MILCGGSDGFLYEVEIERYLNAVDRLILALRRVASFDNRPLTQAEWQQREVAVRDAQQLDQTLTKTIRQLTAPNVANGNFSASLQGMLVDAVKGRIYYNRCALDYQRPDRLIGQFKRSTRGRHADPDFAEFAQRYPWFDQVRAVSPDGLFAASGNHLYRADDFTLVGELPVIAPAVCFAADSASLWFADPINRVLVNVPVPRREGDAEPKAAPAADPAAPPPAAKASAEEIAKLKQRLDRQDERRRRLVEQAAAGEKGAEILLEDAERQCAQLKAEIAAMQREIDVQKR